MPCELHYFIKIYASFALLLVGSQVFISHTSDVMCICRAIYTVLYIIRIFWRIATCWEPPRDPAYHLVYSIPPQLWATYKQEGDMLVSPMRRIPKLEVKTMRLMSGKMSAAVTK